MAGSDIPFGGIRCRGWEDGPGLTEPRRADCARLRFDGVYSESFLRDLVGGAFGLGLVLFWPELIWGGRLLGGVGAFFRLCRFPRLMVGRMSSHTAANTNTSAPNDATG